MFPDLRLTPKGEVIPDGFHWDGHRIVRNYKGSKRPEGIDSELWKMLGPQERKAIIEEEAKAKAKKQEDKPEPSSGSKSKKKKASLARLEATQCPPAKARLVGNTWEIIPADSQKFSVPAMPKAAAPATIEHRPQLRELVKEKIKELEFKVALELFASVARLVSKDEIASNPKAKAALDKEWENLRVKGVWDEKGQEKQFSVMDKMDQTNSSTLQWQVKPDQDLIATNARRRRKPRPLSSGGLTTPWRTKLASWPSP